MKLTAESTVINDIKLGTDIDSAQSTADTATTKADNAQSTADTAVANAAAAQSTADSAKSVADNTAQYFWFTSSGSDTGAHISEKTQAEFIASPSGGNLLARSNGIAVRDGLTELASFGSTVQIGKASDSLRLLSNEVQFYLDGVKSASLTTTQTTGGGRHVELKNETTHGSTLELLSGLVGLSTGTGTTTDPLINARYGGSTIHELNVNGNTWFEVDTSGYFSAPQRNIKVLWSGASYMGANQRADCVYGDNFISQLNGIVLAWSPYSNGSAVNYYWHYNFIPTSHLADHEGQGVSSGLLLGGPTLSYVGSKYVYVHNVYVEGTADNTATGTANGITYANNRWVLRYILGV